MQNMRNTITNNEITMQKHQKPWNPHEKTMKKQSKQHRNLGTRTKNNENTIPTHQKPWNPHQTQ